MHAELKQHKEKNLCINQINKQNVPLTRYALQLEMQVKCMQSVNSYILSKYFSE